MILVAAQLGGALAHPSVLLLCLSLAGLGLTWFGRVRAGRRFLLGGLGGYLAVLVLPLSSWALLPLEDRFPRPAEPARVDGIIVLSGALDAELSRDRGMPSLNAAADRMTETVALALRHPAARVVFTGATGDMLPGSAGEAAWGRRLLLELGVSGDRLVIEGASRNTFENAKDAMQLVNPAAGERWLLVTSANHMPRSVGVFRRAGWTVTPWPVAYKAGHSWRAWMTPSLPDRLRGLDTAAHEWIGLLVYWLLGRTDALFPAPRIEPS